MRDPTKAAFLAILGICALGQSALAADIPVRKAAPAPVYVPYNWNGWYVGAHLGYGWGDKEWSDATGAYGGARVSHGVDGWLGGFQTGFNVQSGNWLWGVEGQWSWTGIDGGRSISLFGFIPVDLDADIDWIATLTARVGIVSDRWLWYLKGGGAWAKENFTASVPGIVSFSATDTRSGWTVGVGVEYAWGGNWTSKLEYNYLDFRDRTHTFLFPDDVRIDQHVHVVKVGLNYKFDWGKAPAAVPARY
jgi:outer membrane immunogenic protein